MTGKLLLKITQVTDGTAETTFTRLVYGRYDYAKSDWERDLKTGKVPTITEDRYLEGNPDPRAIERLKHYKLMPGDAGIQPDENDVAVYYALNPDVELVTIKGEDQEKILNGHAKCSHGDFLAVVQKVEEIIAEEEEKLEVAKREKEAGIAALTADAILNKTTAVPPKPTPPEGDGWTPEEIEYITAKHKTTKVSTMAAKLEVEESSLLEKMAEMGLEPKK